LMRMVRSGQWDASVLVSEMSRDVLNWLPARTSGSKRTIFSGRRLTPQSI
jgi:hypothetical protein